MQDLKVDVAVIGGGTAGLGAYRAAREHSDDVALIEGGVYGTTCARVGCMPSKLLIAAAEAAHRFDSAAEFGVHPLGAPRIDGCEVMARVRRERDRFVGFVLESVDHIDSAHRLSGHASFLDDHTLQVGDDLRVQAERIVIASGSRPVWPSAWQAIGERLLVSDDVFYWQDLPASVVVVGAGVIGLELGQALHRLGVRVLLLGRGNQVGPLSDPEVAAYARDALAAEFPIDVDARVDSLQLSGDGVEVAYVDSSGEHRSTHTQYVIAATGRHPNVDKLGLDRLNIKCDDKGVPIASPYTMQTSQPHIFIAGDASDQVPLLHEASDQGRIAGHNAGRYPDVRPGARRSHLSIVFSDPQIAMVGSSYRTLHASHGSEDRFAIGSVSFENQGRSRVMLRNKGLLRVYGEQGTGNFLGAEMIGPDAEHIGHLLAWAHQGRMTVSQMLAMPFYHPVVQEGLRSALRDLNAKLHIGPEMLEECMECGPGT